MCRDRVELLPDGAGGAVRRRADQVLAGLRRGEVRVWLRHGDGEALGRGGGVLAAAGLQVQVDLGREAEVVVHELPELHQHQREPGVGGRRRVAVQEVRDGSRGRQPRGGGGGAIYHL